MLAADVPLLILLSWLCCCCCCCPAQLPAVICRGVTVVVCPLLSLMQDQVGIAAVAVSAAADVADAAHLVSR
jgi:hypothetical protein